MADKTLTELVINRGTKQKFDDLPTKSPDELYFITDSDYFATKTDLPESKAGTTGQVYTKTETGAEWQDAGGSSVDIDNLTITENTSNKIQAVATINANTATGATNPIYDWVGTLAEYNAQNIETLHPDWVCFITDDESGGESVYTKTEVDTIANGKVNVGHEVIEFQVPTADNNYTWYRKYADGWVEQGGRDASGIGTKRITLPIAMANDKFTAVSSTQSSEGNSGVPINVINATTIDLVKPNTVAFWQVSGMSA